MGLCGGVVGVLAAELVSQLVQPVVNVVQACIGLLGAVPGGVEAMGNKAQAAADAKTQAAARG